METFAWVCFCLDQHFTQAAAHQIFTQRSGHICLIMGTARVNTGPTSQPGFRGRTCTATPHKQMLMLKEVKANLNMGFCMWLQLQT